MAKLVTEHELKGIGTHVRKTGAKAAAERLRELTMPALIVIGENDLPYLKARSRLLGRPVASSLQASHS